MHIDTTALPPGLPGSFIELLWGEGQLGIGSVRLQYSPSTMPGLLQDEEYAIEAISAGDPRLPRIQVARRARLRLARQSLLEGPAELVFLIDKAAIRRVVGGPAAMTAQLEHLATLARLPAVTVQVAAGLYPGIGPGYEILDIAPSICHLYQEDQGRGRYQVNPPELADYRVRFRRTRQAALSVPQSLKFIEDAAADLSVCGA